MVCPATRPTRPTETRRAATQMVLVVHGDKTDRTVDDLRLCGRRQLQDRLRGSHMGTRPTRDHDLELVNLARDPNG